MASLQNFTERESTNLVKLRNADGHENMPKHLDPHLYLPQDLKKSTLTPAIRPKDLYPPQLA